MDGGSDSKRKVQQFLLVVCQLFPLVAEKSLQLSHA